MTHIQPTVRPAPQFIDAVDPPATRWRVPAAEPSTECVQEVDVVNTQ